MKIDTTIQQIKEILTNDAVKRVLVTSGKNVDPDALGSALAMALALEKMGKQVIVAIEEFDGASMAFLPTISRVQDKVGQKSLVVTIDVGANPIEKINYNAEETKFNLILTPKSGQVDVDQIQYSYAGLNYDAVVVVDTASRALMGEWVDSFAKELQEIPVINIDHHADNELFGTLNLVQPDKPSASMVVYELLQALNIELTPDMLTNMLAGILSDTSGFVNKNANAESLQMSAVLVEGGADLHGVTQGIFRTMSLPALHLWGRVLSRVEMVDPGVVVADVQLEDLTSTAASEADEDTLGGLVNNFITAVPGALVGVMLKEKDNGEVKGSLRSINTKVNVQAMAKQLNGGGHVLASGFKLTNTTLTEARQRVIEVVQQELTKNKQLTEEEASKKASE